jgi:large subunit ribosomal protein L25
MKDITLSVELREETGRRARKASQGRVPAVVYGHGFEAKNVWVDPVVFARVFEQAGTNTVISIAVGKEKPVQALIHDFQVNPTSNEITHLDFFHVRMDEKVDTQIPLVFTGEAEAVKALGGTLATIESVHVRALPGDLAHEFTVDITSLKTFDDRITIADLGISDKIEVLDDPATPVASVSAPRVQSDDVVEESAEEPTEPELVGASEEKTEEA